MMNEKAYLLTWNPKYYEMDREVRFVTEEGYCFGHWRTNSRQMEPGDYLLLMRQGSEPRGIVAFGYARKHRQFVFHEGYWFVSVIWKWLAPRDPLFSLDDLNALFPEQHWSPRGSGIEIVPPVADEFIPMFKKALAIKNVAL